MPNKKGQRPFGHGLDGQKHQQQTANDLENLVELMAQSNPDEFIRPLLASEQDGILYDCFGEAVDKILDEPLCNQDPQYDVNGVYEWMSVH